MQSDPELINCFRKQLRTVLASGNPDALLGLWIAWKDQPDTRRDDLVDVLKEEDAELPAG
jgi:hypothetical protein